MSKPKHHEIEIHRLHPTQITVGMIEVEDKREKLESLGKHHRKEFMGDHPIPAVWGPQERLYLIDHHHLARAASEAEVDKGFFDVRADWSSLDKAEFWKRMLAEHWAHPIDEHGRPQSCELIPKHVEKLRDDVYRSLAGYVRNLEGFVKSDKPFAEFLWADFFRTRISIEPGREGFHRAVSQALKLAASSAAASLPGYKGST